MRKLYTLLLLTSAFILGACTPKPPTEDTKVQIYKSYMGLTEVTEFSDVKDVDDMIVDKQNFILVSYADYTCSCWSTFRDFVLAPYISDTNIPIYAIASNLLAGDYRGLPINRGQTNTPVIGVYEEGVYKFGLAYNEDSSVFTQKDKFTSWLERYILKPVMKYIPLSHLNTLLEGTDPFIVYWSLSVCPDCHALDRNFLPGFLKEHKGAQKLPLYVIETYEMRVNTPELWTEIKNNYGLSELKNTVSGYGTGYVPGLQVIHPDGTNYLASGDISPIITDMFVFQNEFVEKVGDVYKISNSYFNGVRAVKYLGNYESEIGKTVDASKVVETTNGPRFVAGSRYDINALYAEKFFSYYWK